MPDRRAEERIDLVADVLLDRATVAFDEPSKLAESRAERGLQPFGTEPNRELGRADNVDEEARDQPALFATIHRATRLALLTAVPAGCKPPHELRKVHAQK